VRYESVLEPEKIPVAPRRIDQGRRQVRQTKDLEKDARNLADALDYLRSHDPVRRFPSVERFMREAFPEIVTISVPTDPENGMGEIEIFFEGRDAPIPLRLCGTGVEQMLASQP
jgi:predicted ATPase